MNLIIDIGNTSAKLAVFDGSEIKEVVRSSNCTLEGMAALCDRYPIHRGILSTVVSINETIHGQLQKLPFPILEFTYRTAIPIRNLYKTPQTLGVDRLAAVVGAYMQKPDCPALVIDAGTCITYDFIDGKGQYHGGNISPGMEMRFKSLHTFTDRLPQVRAEGDTPIHGYSTETAIRSGVIRGIEHEIMGYIHQLKKNYPSLLVFLTGGNEFSFDTNLKNTIFADGFLVLKGLNRILEYNGVI